MECGWNCMKFLGYEIKLKYTIQQSPIELNKVQHTVKIQPALAVVQIYQIYSTEQIKDQCELEYLFTKDQNSAVTKMIVKLGDQKVYGVIKELEEAKTEYKREQMKQNNGSKQRRFNYIKYEKGKNWLLMSWQIFKNSI
ncbi:unnamed protein product [Paramecium octaurelia]|uniref:VIT domain-containing protein n=1 Tax=Paramecium octaurelia TaxID=43137 RepID=A0A8S1WBM7_PAROT|nr:unnamed protein product [Paramecium octaurelia]